MKTLLHSRDAASKGAALMIVLALVVLLTGISLAYFSRTTTDRQLAQSSYNDTSADLLARSALDTIVGDFKQELLDPSSRTVTRSNIQPQNCGGPADRLAIPNLIRRSVRLDQPGQANAMPAPGVPSLASAVSSSDASGNGRSISTTRWNSHYLIPRGNTNDTTIDSSPIPSFTSPDWVLITPQGPNSAPLPSAVIGRYAFAVYDEGGLLDMTVAGAPINHANYPPPDNQYGWGNLSVCSAPGPTPWLVNVGRKGTTAFADLTALPAAPTTNLPQSQVDNIVGWRNYATTQRTGANFRSFNYSGDPNNQTTCNNQDIYGSYMLYFGDPPFVIENVTNLVMASFYPFTAVYPGTSGTSGALRTDQSLMTRQELLKMRGALGFSQNVLQYMGTFSRERNRPAPDWPNLNGTLSEGRFNLNNLALVVPNPCDPSVGPCVPPNGRKKGWQTGKNRNHLFGTVPEIVELFGLFWVKAGVIDPTYKTPGHWTYVDHTGPNPPGDPDPDPHSIICFRGANQQEDFFQILHYALNVMRAEGGRRCAGPDRLPRTFAIGASLIDQYDSGADCLPPNTPDKWAGTGCDLDPDAVTHNGNNQKNATHTTVIRYGQGPGQSSFAFGMEPNYSSIVGSDGYVNGDCAPSDNNGNAPHRPCGDKGGDCAPPNEQPAPPPAASTQVVSHAFSNVGELGYGIDSSPNGVTSGLPTLDFNPPNFPDAPVLDFFSYNPISSAWPRAGIVNLYTKNAPVLAAILAQTLKTDAAANSNPPAPVISGTPAANSEAIQLANAIVAETQGLLAGAPPSGWPVTQIDMTRAIAGRLAARGTSQVWGLGTSNEIRNSIARALAEVGQTRTWNLFIDVIAQTGKYKPSSADLSGSNFVVEGEKRYWLHISLGRDLKINLDGTQSNDVDVLGTQLEEVIE